MKFNCGPTYQQRIAAKEKWHRWFAWYPVRIGPNDCRWLECVERKGKHHCSWFDEMWLWEYRAAMEEK